MKKIRVPLHHGATYICDTTERFYYGPGSLMMGKFVQPDVYDFDSHYSLSSGGSDVLRELADILKDDIGAPKRGPDAIKCRVGKPKSKSSFQRKLPENASLVDLSVCQTGDEFLSAFVSDQNRMQIFVPPKLIPAVLNRLTPNRDVRVMSAQDEIANIMTNHAIPWYKVIYNTGELKEGQRYGSEVMVLPKVMEKVYDETRPLYAKEQQCLKAFSQAGAIDFNNAKKLSKMFSDYSTNRREEHLKVRADCGFQDYLLDRRAHAGDVIKYFVYLDDRGNDQHFFTMPDVYENRRPIALRPDFEKGVFVTDKSEALLKMLHDPHECEQRCLTEDNKDTFMRNVIRRLSIHNVKVGFQRTATQPEDTVYHHKFKL